MKKLCFIVFLAGFLLAGSLCFAAEKCGPEPRLRLPMHRAMHKAHKLLEKQDHKGALAILDKFAKEHESSQHYRFSFMRGVLCYQLKRTALAGKYFEKTIKLRPCFGPAMRNLAAILYEQGKPLEAAQMALKAYNQITPEQPELLYEAAVFYLSGQKPLKSLPLLKELAQKPKPKKSWLTALVRVYMELKQPINAKPVVKRLLVMAPQDEMLWRLLASLQLALKKHDKAAAALEVAYRLKPPQKSGWRNLAGLYRASGVPLQAAKYYKKAFGPNPTAKELDLLTGVYLQGNYHQKALEVSYQVAELEPTHKRLARVGRILLQRKQYVKAFHYFTKAAKLKDPKGKYSLMAGYCAMQMDKLKDAENAFSLAMKKAHKGSTTAKEAAKALKAVRNYQQALREQEQMG